MHCIVGASIFAHRASRLGPSFYQRRRQYAETSGFSWLVVPPNAVLERTGPHKRRRLRIQRFEHIEDLKKRAVRMVQEAGSEYASQWAAITSIAAKIGCTSATLRRWVRQCERNPGSSA
jgi:hypothetical protein